MITLTISNGKIVISHDVVLFNELQDLYDLKNTGEPLLRVIHYIHSKAPNNPFKDLSAPMRYESAFMTVFKKPSLKALKLNAEETRLFNAAEKIYIKHTSTPEKRLEASLDRKMDELSTMLDGTVPVIEESITKNNETKYNTNVNIILNLFSKIEVIMKAKDKLQAVISKQESIGKVKGGSISSFRDRGIL